MKVKITKLKTLRKGIYSQFDDGFEFVGEEQCRLQKGEVYQLINESEYFHTSSVVEILNKDENEIIFETKNSIYKIKYLFEQTNHNKILLLS